MSLAKVLSRGPPVITGMSLGSSCLRVRWRPRSLCMTAPRNPPNHPRKADAFQLASQDKGAPAGESPPRHVLC
jgi:hypothetical protein